MRLRFSISHFGRCRRGATGLRRRYGRHGVPLLGSRRIGCPRDPSSVFAAHPAVVPETVVVDHGKIYVGEHLTSCCRQLGISIQPARVRVPYDKGPVERFFRTLREGFLQELPGYKGPDVFPGGISPSRTLSSSWTNWRLCCANGWQLFTTGGPHSGIGETGLWALRLSPAQMFEHGIFALDTSRRLAIPAWPTDSWRCSGAPSSTTASEIDGRYYRGPGLSSYVAREKSPFSEKGGRWPVHVDPDDVRQVYFFDLKTTQTMACVGVDRSNNVRWPDERRRPPTSRASWRKASTGTSMTSWRWLNFSTATSVRATMAERRARSNRLSREQAARVSTRGAGAYSLGSAYRAACPSR